MEDTKKWLEGMSQEERDYYYTIFFLAYTTAEERNNGALAEKYCVILEELQKLCRLSRNDIVALELRAINMRAGLERIFYEFEAPPTQMQ